LRDRARSLCTIIGPFHRIIIWCRAVIFL
jgi:hypothetical protein